MKRIENQSGFQWAAQVLREGSRNEKENFSLAEAPATGRNPFLLAEVPATGREPFSLAEAPATGRNPFLLAEAPATGRTLFSLAESPGHWCRINGTNKCAGMQQRKEVRFITNNISFKRQLC